METNATVGELRMSKMLKLKTISKNVNKKKTTKDMRTNLTAGIPSICDYIESNNEASKFYASSGCECKSGGYGQFQVKCSLYKDIYPFFEDMDYPKKIADFIFVANVEACAYNPEISFDIYGYSDKGTWWFEKTVENRAQFQKYPIPHLHAKPEHCPPPWPKGKCPNYDTVDATVQLSTYVRNKGNHIVDLLFGLDMCGKVGNQEMCSQELDNYVETKLYFVDNENYDFSDYCGPSGTGNNYKSAKGNKMKNERNKNKKN